MSGVLLCKGNQIRLKKPFSPSMKLGVFFLPPRPPPSVRPFLFLGRRAFGMTAAVSVSGGLGLRPQYRPRHGRSVGCRLRVAGAMDGTNVRSLVGSAAED